MSLKILIVGILFFSMVFAKPSIQNFKAQNLNFKTISFDEIKGEKITLIDFWATWCTPCIQAIPKLNILREKYMDKGVEVVGINTDSPRNSAKVMPFVKTYKMEYPVLRDPNSKLARMLNVSAYPTLFIINNQNEIIYTHTGFKIGDEKIIEQEIIKLLDDK
jgi:thiol-disulfide isomerase/thioredoxin